MKRILPFVIIGAVAIIAGAAAAWLYKPQGPGVPFMAKSGAPGATPLHLLGPTNPRVTIEEFGDFQCPPCGKLHPVLNSIHEEYASSVAIVFREFPMTKIHANALEAARAAEAAGLQGAFWEMHDFIYDIQDHWKDQKDVRSWFARQAAITGLDPMRFRRDMDSAEVQRRIAADQQRGESLGVTGTPTVFLNGRLLAPDELNHLRELIDAALRQPQSPAPAR